jgi:hypothetical protein
MRPTTEEGTFHVATDVKDGKVQIIVSALDKEDQFLNFLSMQATVTDDESKSTTVPIRQVAPGRYIGEYDTDQAGAYMVNVSGELPSSPGDEDKKDRPRRFSLRTGVSVPYSDEYRNRETNRALIDFLAGLTPEGGEPGEVIDGNVQRGNLDPLLAVNTFRHNLAKAVSSSDIWPWLLLTMACLFLGDVFIRRVQITWEWLAPVSAWFNRNILRRQPAAEPDERMARLKSRKTEATAGHDERRAAARFEPQPDADIDTSALDEGASRGPPIQHRQAASGSVAPTGPEEETYTERLKKAKEKALKGKQKRSD